MRNGVRNGVRNGGAHTIQIPFCRIGFKWLMKPNPALIIKYERLYVNLRDLVWLGCPAIENR